MCNSIASEPQWSILMAYIKENNEFAAEIVNSGGPLEIRGNYDHWADLAIRLNSVTGSIKTPMQWRQYWNDKKYALRGRIRRQQANATEEPSGSPERDNPPAATPAVQASSAAEASPSPSVSSAPAASSTAAALTVPVDSPAAPAPATPPAVTTSPAPTQANLELGRAFSSSPIIRRYRSLASASERAYELKQRRLILEERRLALDQQLVTTLERGLEVQTRIATAQEKMLAVQERIAEVLLYGPDALFSHEP